MKYTGRFAPSPTGPLHFGSLLAALASFLDARAHQGRWLLRIEDLDPAREQPGASDSFPRVLETFGLYWDDACTLQSERLEFYQEILNTLLSQGDAYPCSCSRKAVQARSGSAIYDRYCLEHPVNNQKQAAIRVHCPDAPICFEDRIQGHCCFDLQQHSGDFVVLRKDGLFAYQLAVVVDDHLQGITHVVRGSDLLSETPKQIHLQQKLALNSPRYAHIPVITNAQGQKLSKQTFAPALDLANPVPQLIKALDCLNQQPDPALGDASTEELLQWATGHWSPGNLPPQLKVPLSQ
ncbi:MAG: tRNA glutamyl-Q(34) synthetase GluQRS [Pontibacterium sp.]